MEFFDPNSEGQYVAPSRRRELVIEVLKILTPALGLLLFLLGLNSKYAWLSTPWIRATLAALGILTVAWFAKPRFTMWLKKLVQKKRQMEFVATAGAELHKLAQQFGEFISDNDSRSFICTIRSGFSQNMTAVEQVLAGDYIASWFYAYREELSYAPTGVPQLLARCREFGNMVQQFNSYYVLRAQKHLAAAATPLPEHSIAALEQFREEYNAFLRELESWMKGNASYIQSLGVTTHAAIWQLAPTVYYERAKPFSRTRAVGG